MDRDRELLQFTRRRAACDKWTKQMSIMITQNAITMSSKAVTRVLTQLLVRSIEFSLIIVHCPILRHYLSPLVPPQEKETYIPLD